MQNRGELSSGNIPGELLPGLLLALAVPSPQTSGLQAQPHSVLMNHKSTLCAPGPLSAFFPGLWVSIPEAPTGPCSHLPILLPTSQSPLPENPRHRCPPSQLTSPSQPLSPSQRCPMRSACVSKHHHCGSIITALTPACGANSSQDDLQTCRYDASGPQVSPSSSHSNTLEIFSFEE